MAVRFEIAGQKPEEKDDVLTLRLEAAPDNPSCIFLKGKLNGGKEVEILSIDPRGMYRFHWVGLLKDVLAVDPDGKLTERT